MPRYLDVPVGRVCCTRMLSSVSAPTNSAGISTTSFAPPFGEVVKRAKVTAGPRLILLVEDDFILRSALSELLRDEGYAVECAANGVEALRRVLQPPRPALV